jgi:hypothetical protein
MPVLLYIVLNSFVFTEMYSVLFVLYQHFARIIRKSADVVAQASKATQLRITQVDSIMNA